MKNLIRPHETEQTNFHNNELDSNSLKEKL